MRSSGGEPGRDVRPEQRGTALRRRRLRLAADGAGAAAADVISSSAAAAVTAGGAGRSDTPARGTRRGAGRSGPPPGGPDRRRGEAGTGWDRPPTASTRCQLNVSRAGRRLDCGVHRLKTAQDVRSYNCPSSGRCVSCPRTSDRAEHGTGCIGVTELIRRVAEPTAQTRTIQPRIRELPLRV